jgi:hypothetical protein
MGLGSLGVAVSPEALWPAIATADGEGRMAARTSSLAGESLKRGVPAVAAQFLDDWESVVFLLSGGMRVIANHRPEVSSRKGHFSVIVAIEPSRERLWLHDPERGPRRRLSRKTWGRLWSPVSEEGEIRGRVAVVLGPGDAALRDGSERASERRCGRCGKMLPEALDCPECGRPVPLSPLAALGCLSAACGARRWERLFCPQCDGTILPRD